MLTPLLCLLLELGQLLFQSSDGLSERYLQHHYKLKCGLSAATMPAQHQRVLDLRWAYGFYHELYVSVYMCVYYERKYGINVYVLSIVQCKQ